MKWARAIAIALPPALLVPLVLRSVCTTPEPRVFRQQILDPHTELGQEAPTFLYVSLNGSSYPCSAVAVGPHVLLTAAHCVDYGQVTIQTPDPKTGDCKVPEGNHPAPSSGGCSDTSKSPKVADLAACYFEEGFTDGIEAVSTAVSNLAQDTEVVLNGFGCSGTVKCKPKSWGQKVEPRKAHILETASDQDLLFLTIGDPARNGSALCYGDSGGPVSIETPSGRRIVGIAHGGCVECDDHMSAVTSLAAEATVEWLCEWVKEEPKKRAIQGLSCP